MVIDLASLFLSILAGTFLGLQLSEKNMFKRAIYIVLTISCMIFGMGFTIMHSGLPLLIRTLLAARFLVVELTTTLLVLATRRVRRGVEASTDYV